MTCIYRPPESKRDNIRLGPATPLPTERVEEQRARGRPVPLDHQLPPQTPRGREGRPRRPPYCSMPSWASSRRSSMDTPYRGSTIRLSGRGCQETFYPENSNPPPYRNSCAFSHI